MRQRGALRVVPRSPVTVAIDELGLPLAYGVVANISEGGACVWTDARFESGRRVHLRLSFARETQPLDAEGVVVWGGPHAEGGVESLRYGLRWTDTSPARREHLKKLIAASA
jgi:Tfp pilus assembly protein PilZ